MTGGIPMKIWQTKFWLIALCVILVMPIIKMAKAADDTEEWHVPPGKSEIANPFPSDEKTLATGKKVYAGECLSCHGKTGMGDGPKAQELEKKISDLNSKKVLDQSDGALFWKISTGRKPMPAYKKLLSDEERWAVVDYMRKLCQPK